jgi:hypothetical protein
MRLSTCSLFYKDLCQDLTDHVNVIDKFRASNLPSDLSNPTKSKDEDIPVFALIPKAIPYEFVILLPPLLYVGDVDAIAVLQLIGEAAAIIGEAW